MKSLVQLLEEVLADASTRCGAHTAKDLSTVRRRVEDEGDSFLTITLPAFAADFERSLELGRVAPGAFLGFRKVSGIPAFLQGFLCNVFDPEGALLDKPSVDCIKSVRQVCLMFKKLRRECTQARNVKAIEGYVEVDDKIEALARVPHLFQKVADVVMSSIIGTESWYEEITPRHGPGATAEGVFGNQKYRWQSWPERLEGFFPFLEFAYPLSLAEADDLLATVDFVEPGAETPVKVVLVPKTLKTPRIIAVEPVSMQYAQQALASWLYRRSGESRYTTGRVNFHDQSVNQALALDASRSGYFATLDMSEASDRVAFSHAEALYRCNPNFWAAVDSCRSRRAKLPNGEIRSIAKFASMGSALCFPTEAFVFFCAIVSARLDRAKVAVSPRSVYEYSRDVYVFGDDLIVPKDEAPGVCIYLEAMGFKVNSRKSFWTGKFRESCGMDAYDGEEVTPSYLRWDLPSHASEADRICSIVALANQLRKKQFNRAADYLRKVVEDVVGNLPHVEDESGILGFCWDSYRQMSIRWNADLHRHEVRALVPSSKRTPDLIDGYAALTKCLLSSSKERPDWHLTESLRPYSLTLRRRWVSTDKLSRAAVE